MGGFEQSDPNFGLHLSEVISDPDVKRKHCCLSVQEPLRVGEDLEEGVGWKGSCVTLSVQGLGQFWGVSELGEDRLEKSPW